VQVGQVVVVQQRMWRGVNKEGGHGIIEKIDSDLGTANVKYVLGGSESGVHYSFLSFDPDTSQRGRNSAPCSVSPTKPPNSLQDVNPADTPPPRLTPADDSDLKLPINLNDIRNRGKDRLYGLHVPGVSSLSDADVDANTNITDGPTKGCQFVDWTAVQNDIQLMCDFVMTSIQDGEQQKPIATSEITETPLLDSKKATPILTPQQTSDGGENVDPLQEQLDPVMESDSLSTTKFEHAYPISHPYTQAKKIQQFAEQAIAPVSHRHQREIMEFLINDRLDRLGKENKEAAVQGQPQFDPYPHRPFEKVPTYVPSTAEAEAQNVLSKLETQKVGTAAVLPGEKCGELQFYDSSGPLMTKLFEDKVQALVDSCESKEEASIALASLVSSETLTVCEDPADTESSDPLQMVDTWGIDCFTRKNIEIAIDDAANGKTIEVGKQDKSAQDFKKLNEQEQKERTALKEAYFEKWLFPRVNAVREIDPNFTYIDVAEPCSWRMELALRAILAETKEDDPSLASIRSVSLAILDAMDKWGAHNFRVHPKGRGVVCNQHRISAGHILTQYLGEVFPAWQWAEKQQAMEYAQKFGGLKAALPSFYNITLERHPDDSEGYDLMFVDGRRTVRPATCSMFSDIVGDICMCYCAVFGQITDFMLLIYLWVLPLILLVCYPSVWSLMHVLVFNACAHRS
jgi:hypothetical protein